MDGHVGLGPEDLVAAGLRARPCARAPPSAPSSRCAAGRPRRRCTPGRRRRPTSAGRAALIEELDEPGRRLGVAGRAAQAQPALAARGGHGHRPAGALVTEHLAVGHLDAVEEDLGESGLPVDLGNRPHGDPGGVHGDEEVGQPAVALCFGIGAEDAEAPFGERAPAGPGLLAGEQPPVTAGVAHGPRADAGQVAPGVGLRPTLAPDLLACGHRGQEAHLLRRRPVLEQGRGQEEDAVLAHPFRAPGPGSTPPRR